MKIGDLPCRKTKECSIVEGIAPGHDSRGYSLIPVLLLRQDSERLSETPSTIPSCQSRCCQCSCMADVVAQQVHRPLAASHLRDASANGAGLPQTGQAARVNEQVPALRIERDAFDVTAAPTRRCRARCFPSILCA